jgi:hypothetical protein
LEQNRPIYATDLEAALLSCLDDKTERHSCDEACAYVAVLLVISSCTFLATVMGYSLFVDPDLSIGHLKLSMEPLAYTGLDLSPDGAVAAPLSFNVTLHATNKFRHTFCSSGAPPATLQAAFSGMTV